MTRYSFFHGKARTASRYGGVEHSYPLSRPTSKPCSTRVSRNHRTSSSVPANAFPLPKQISRQSSIPIGLAPLRLRKSSQIQMRRMRKRMRLREMWPQDRVQQEHRVLIHSIPPSTQWSSRTRRSVPTNAYSGGSLLAISLSHPDEQRSKGRTSLPSFLLRFTKIRLRSSAPGGPHRAETACSRELQSPTDCQQRHS